MKKILIVILVPFIVGCGGARAIRSTDVQYPPTDQRQVEVYEDFPSFEYEIIGKVTGRAASTADWDAVDECMSIEAAKIGGNAVVVEEKYDSYTPGASSPMFAKQAKGVVIRYKGERSDMKQEPTSIIKCPKGHPHNYKEGMTEVKCVYCEKTYSIDECRFVEE